MNKKVIITTGGTGGHIFPAQSVAQELCNQGFKVTIFGDEHYRKYHKAGSIYQYKIISSSKLSRSAFGLILASLKISYGILQSLLRIALYRPGIVVAFGGYATFPVLIAAIICRRKIILHEQNAHLGKVNRIFAPLVKTIALSYHQTFGILGKEINNKTVFTGNPIRQSILNLSNIPYKLPDYKPSSANNLDNKLGYDLLLASDFHQQSNLANPGDLFNILVLGGSGGAKIFSEVLPKAFFNLRDNIKNHLSITQQCRAEYLSSTFNQYQSFNLNIIINSFFEDIEEQIKKAHLVIARSGSSSLAEFTCARKPMILIPFAAAADNHQEKNALHIEKMGGAIVIRETDFTINTVTSTLEKLIDNPGILIKMSEAAFKCANLEAAHNLTKLIIKSL